MKDVIIPPAFFSGLPVLCIDASSMIYHLKTGLLGTLAAESRLISTERVIREVGWPHLPVESFTVDDESVSNDESLLILAEREEVPVVSEDKEILEQARDRGREHYNTLMMLNYLYMKGRVSPEEYPEYLSRLIDCSRYSREVLAYGRTVFELIQGL